MALYFFNSRRRPASSLTGGRVSDDGEDGEGADDEAEDDEAEDDEAEDDEAEDTVPRGVDA